MESIRLPTTAIYLSRWLNATINLTSNYSLVAVIIHSMESVTISQIGLTFGKNAGDMIVTWASDINSTDFRVFYGLDSNASDHNRRPQRIQQYKYNSSLGNYTSPYLYQAKIGNLSVGNVLYYYRIGSASTGYSQTYSFKSNAGVGVPVTFHVVGDVGQNVNSITTFNEMYACEKDLVGLSGGVVFNGDLSYADGNETLWDTFADLKQPVNAQLPFAYIVGNHEWEDTVNATGSYDFLAYKTHYYNPSINGIKQLWYSFERGFVHWVMLAGYCSVMTKSTTAPCLAPGSDQMNWLLQDLASVDRSRTPWLIVSFHQPYVNSNTDHPAIPDGVAMEQALEDVLYTNKVDLVFSGHVHAYERSAQVYHYNVTAGAPWYITIGDGGNTGGLASTWIDPQPSWSLFRQASYGFGELQVFNATHAYWQWYQNEDLTPLISDTFWYVRGEAATNDTPALEHVTKEPKFADNKRGRRAAKFNEEMLKQHPRNAATGSNK